MAYTGRHSYFLCFLQFVFRRSPARLAVKKYAHAKREEDFFTSNQPAGPPCGTGLKNNYFCRKKWGWRITSFYLLSVLWEFKIPCSFSVFGMFGEIFKDVEWERQYVILRKVRKWDWKQEACPGFHAVYTAVLILGRITGKWQAGWPFRRNCMCTLFLPKYGVF